MYSCTSGKASGFAYKPKSSAFLCPWMTLLFFSKDAFVGSVTICTTLFPPTMLLPFKPLLLEYLLIRLPTLPPCSWLPPGWFAVDTFTAKLFHRVFSFSTLSSKLRPSSSSSSYFFTIASLFLLSPPNFAVKLPTKWSSNFSGSTEPLRDFSPSGFRPPTSSFMLLFKSPSISMAASLSTLMAGIKLTSAFSWYPMTICSTSCKTWLRFS
mmetsp:Transcript_9950/g.18063  ORF Transcript_9950/g.18063 Transcript_9950/m.18063 type:complete len:210 (-) Transcript_9950:4530-5159(-)